MMRKKLDHLLNIIMGVAAGVFLGHSAYVYWDYRTHPGLYAMWSAPWYTSILLYGAITAAVLLLAGLCKLIIHRRKKP